MRENTPKQTETSRGNGRKGKGPISPEGKEAIRFNAEKDGIFSTQLIVESAGERIQDFEKLRNELWDSLQPETTLEKMLAVDIIENRWRMQRVRRAERLALQARVESSWIEDDLRRSEQLDILKAEFFNKYEQFLRLSMPELAPEAFDLQPQMEDVRTKLAATSEGLEFLIGLVEKVEEQAASAPYLSWNWIVLLSACCGFGNDLARECAKMNLVSVQANKDESAEAAKVPKSRSNNNKNQDAEEGEASKTTSQKLKELTIAWFLAQDSYSSSDKRSGNTKQRDFVKEIKDAPTLEAWVLAWAVKSVISSMKIRLALVSKQEQLDKEAQKNDAIIPLAGNDRFLRAETAFERRMYRALSLLLAIKSGVVETPQLPPPVISDDDSRIDDTSATKRRSGGPR